MTAWAALALIIYIRCGGRWGVLGHSVAGSTLNGTGAFTICTANWVPMVFCDPSQSQDTYTGYDVELFRAVSRELGWTEGINYNWKCLDSRDALLTSVSTAGEAEPAGGCMAATSGLKPSAQWDDLGVSRSYPTYRSSLAILISQIPVSGGNGWNFSKPFDWTVWAAVGVTVVAFPFIAFIIEFLSCKGHIENSEWLPGYKESLLRGGWTIMLLEPYHLSSFGARVAALCYGFLATILVNTYCANLVAALTVTSIRSQIHKRADLIGRAVGTEPAYVGVLLDKQGIAAGTPQFDNYPQDVAFAVSSGELAAYITDEPRITYLAASDPTCKLAVLVESMAIEYFDYAIALSTEVVSEDLIQSVSDALLKLQERGVMSALQQSFVTSPQGDCTSGQVNQQSSAIQWDDVWGLWVVLAGGVAIGLVCMLLALRRHAAGTQHQYDGCSMDNGHDEQNDQHMSATGEPVPLPPETTQARPLVSFLRRRLWRRKVRAAAVRAASPAPKPQLRQMDTANAEADGESPPPTAAASSPALRQSAASTRGLPAARPAVHASHDMVLGSAPGSARLPSMGPGQGSRSSQLPAGGGVSGGALRESSVLEYDRGLFAEGWREAPTGVFGGANGAQAVFPQLDSGMENT